MAGTTVSHQQLDQAANHAITTGETIKSGLSRVMTEVEGAAAGFQGLAGNALQSTSQELANELSNLIQALHTMADNVKSSNASFSNTDETGSTQIQNVAGTYTPSGTVTQALRG